MSESTVTQGYTLGYRNQDRSCVRDNQELDTFLASVERSAFRMAEIATRDSDDAVDVVQDAMIKLVEKYAHKPRTEWRPLFFRILQSRITDFHRRKSRTARIFSWFGSDNGEELDAVGAEQTGPLDILLEQLTLDSLIAGLERLPPRQQQVFLLRNWEGLSVAETVKAMKCGEGSVKTHLSRATATLMKAVLDGANEARVTD